MPDGEAQLSQKINESRPPEQEFNGHRSELDHASSKREASLATADHSVLASSVPVGDTTTSVTLTDQGASHRPPLSQETLARAGTLVGKRAKQVAKLLSRHTGVGKKRAGAGQARKRIELKLQEARVEALKAKDEAAQIRNELRNVKEAREASTEELRQKLAATNDAYERLRYENALNEFRARHRKRERDEYREAFQASRYIIFKPRVLRQRKLLQQENISLIERSGVFDSRWYSEQCGEAPSNPIRHFLWQGALDGLDPHPLFNTQWYLLHNRAARMTGENPLIHYLTTGWKKNCDPHPWFNVGWYLSQCPELQKSGREPLSHFISEGWKQDKQPHPHFDIGWYRGTYLGDAAKSVNPLLDFVTRGQNEGCQPSPVASGTETASFLPPRPAARADDLSPSQTAPKPSKIATTKSPKWQLPPLFRKTARSIDLVDAYDVALSGDHARAIALAERLLPSELKFSADILRANAAISLNDEETWLQHVNRYLGHFGVPGIKLSAGDLLIDRLRSDPEPPIQDGPLISVLMPAWNAEKTISAAARSILGQTWRNLELIIIDDHSEDQTWAIANELARADARVKVLRNSQNVGPYVSKNIGLMGARGEFVTGHDADDWAHPRRLASQAHYLLENDAVACLSGMLRMEFSGHIKAAGRPKRNTIDGATRTAFISLMIRRRFLRHRLNGWDDVRFGADSELIRRLERATRKHLPRLMAPTMICFDNPQGLTNHPEHGHNRTTGVSDSRKSYILAAQDWHKTIGRRDCSLPFPHRDRHFPAPPAMLNSSGLIEDVINHHVSSGWRAVGDQVSADILIATNLCFPGGNTSSTLDEVRYFTRQHGLSVALIHVPTPGNLGREPSRRYADLSHLIVDFDDIAEASSRVLILRNPSPISAPTFAELAPKLSAEHLFFVKNNSAWRPTGEVIYEPEVLLRNLRRVRAGTRTIAPISPVMRAELSQLGLDQLTDISVSSTDWSPTFDLDLYRADPKPSIEPPYCIGRHGRDGPEKWLSDVERLRQAYPATAEFRVRILGGAKKAQEIMGRLPDNWEVIDFGAIEPRAYLRDLDVFVYFPDDKLAEGFGRTVVEAMIAGVPVVLPPRFEKVFGNLALYAEPKGVGRIVRRLAERDADRLSYLREIQDIAIARYATDTIGIRLAHVFDQLKSDTRVVPPEISDVAANYREWLLTE